MTSWGRAVSRALLLVALVAAPTKSQIGVLVDPEGLQSGVTTVRYEVEGLESEAAIAIDAHGIPHLEAAGFDDLFFVQGFNAARDRLWQLDLWKRRGEGRLAEAFGSDFVEQDKASRLLLFRGDLHAEWLAYASDTKRIVTAFVRGINAFIELTQRHPELLPLEFGLLDYKPALWEPETVVRIRSHGLLRNLRSELRRALRLRDWGPESSQLADHFEPEETYPGLEVPVGLDLDLLSPEVLESYRMGTRGVSFEAEEQARIDERLRTRLADEFELGSNNWVVSGRHTTTGRPIVADDPHRVQAVPSLRYIVHMASPELNIVGAGEPALPGVSIGHNGTVAFGLTIFSIDQEDLYVYETHPDDSTLYRYDDHWLPMSSIVETIEVRDGDSVEVTHWFTRHGPVLHRDPQRQAAFAVRAAWLEPGMAPYLGSIELMRARNWDEFLAAMNRWGAPSENQVYADTTGFIGWKPGGLAPIRPNWDGLLPVPGDGRYEWQGYYDMDQLPVVEDPASGWFGTANQMNLPSGYDVPLGWEWAPNFRQSRITEVLSALERGESRHSIQSSLELQVDAFSHPARRLVAALARWVEPAETSKENREAWSRLLAWSGELAMDSPEAALFEIWWLELADGLSEMLLPEPAVRRPVTKRPRIHPEKLLRYFERRDPDAAGRELLERTLASALTKANERFGRWTDGSWGDIHTIHLEHQLAKRFPQAREWDVGPHPRPGDGYTVGNTSSNDKLNQTSGASFRIVMDVGEWDNSVAINNPGQSGDPRSEHYDDLFLPWAEGNAAPLHYSKSAVTKATKRLVQLVPRRPGEPPKGR